MGGVEGGRGKGECTSVIIDTIIMMAICTVNNTNWKLALKHAALCRTGPSPKIKCVFRVIEVVIATVELLEVPLLVSVFAHSLSSDDLLTDCAVSE